MSDIMIRNYIRAVIAESSSNIRRLNSLSKKVTRDIMTLIKTSDLSRDSDVNLGTYNWAASIDTAQNPDEEFEEPEYYIPLILETWRKKGIKPKFHVSEQGYGKVGKHSDFIDILPDYLLEIPEKYGDKIDVMIEAKMKELSVHDLYEKYPECDCRIKN